MQTGHTKTNRASAARTALALCASALFLLAFASPAWAVSEHLFEPALSLNGGTTTNFEDEVPDPGTTHPPKTFLFPCGTATDPHGDIYVASSDNGSTAGRIDVFNPQGEYISEIHDEFEPCSLAVDSVGNLYAKEYGPGNEGGKVVLYKPKAYPPSSESGYGPRTVIYNPADHPTGGSGCNKAAAVAVDPSNGHLYIAHGLEKPANCNVEEYGTAAEGSPLIRNDVADNTTSRAVGGIDVYGKNHDVYLTTRNLVGESSLLVLDGADTHKTKCVLDGSETAAGSFSFGLGSSIAVDQANGDFYVWDFGHKIVDQFSVEGSECKFIGSLPKPPTLKGVDPFNDIAVDDPLSGGQPGYESPNAGYAFVISGSTATNSRMFAFKPKTSPPPVIRKQEATDISETEALLHAELNPTGLDTTYRFEYTTQAAFKTEGYAGAASVPVPDAAAADGTTFAPVAEQIGGLEPGTAYRFRLLASNCEAEGASEGECLTVGEGNPGGEGDDAGFSTYDLSPVSGPCANAALRSGYSALLPDCRAYELVTPPDTGGHIVTMTMLGRNFGSNGFLTPLASPDGSSVVFGSNSGALPGIGGGGFADTFEASRNESNGWQSEFTGLNGAQAEKPKPGGISADHSYAFWFTEGDKGVLSTDGYQYLRVPAASPEPSPHCMPEAEPEGGFEFVGCGSLGTDPEAQGLWIGPGASHVVFETGRPSGLGSTPVPLEPCTPSSTEAAARTIYTRVPGGATECVSVPPAGASAKTQTEFEKEGAAYLGASADGDTVAFGIGPTTYVGVGDEETVELVSGKMLFGGLSTDGRRAFYLKEPSASGIPHGEIYACEVKLGPCDGPGAQEPIQIGSGAESTLVNVSADGSHVYFVSPKQLDDEGEGEEGKENLYVWNEGSIDLVGIVGALDVSGEFSSFSNRVLGGLGLWAGAGQHLGSAADPSRTSPDGKAFVFESRANLTGYDSGGHREIYRYDGEAPAGERLLCVSCNPTDAAAHSDARLQPDPALTPELNVFPPVNELDQIANVSADGKMVFFQSAERLVPADIDGLTDVYEWEAEGSGGCKRAAGCLSLISSGRSSEDDYLYAATPDGHDVFFLGADTLVAQDPDGTPSIYDARVEGGFPPPGAPPGECLGEACQPPVVVPDDPTPASSSFEGSGNVNEEAPSALRCPKGKHKVKTRGKVHCVKRHPRAHHRKNHRANANRRTAR